MKTKTTITSLFLLFSIFFYAQEAINTNTNSFNQWSVDIGFGVHKPSRNFSDGYFTSTPDLWQGNIGVRYMLNEKFGVSFETAHFNISNAKDSKTFKSNYYSLNIEGVVNAGNILNFNSWTNSFNILVHGGIGVSFLTPQENEDLPQIKDWETEHMLSFIAGITPQLKLTDKLSIFADLSVVGHVSQDYTFNGELVDDIRGFDGMIVSGSIGLSFYFGKEDKHADWFHKRDILEQRIDELSKQVTINNKDIAKLQETLEEELEDNNDNSIPDNMEPALDALYADKIEEFNNALNKRDLKKELIDNGYINVFFKTNSIEPEDYNAIAFLVQYMKENPSAQAEIIGYTDQKGSADYNMKLSEKRAENVYNYLINSNISESRLSFIGNGIDNSNKESAMQLSRIVKFKIK